MDLEKYERKQKALSGAIINSPVWKELTELAELFIAKKTTTHMKTGKVDFDSQGQAEGVKEFIKDIARWTERRFVGESYSYSFGEQENAE